MLFGLASATLLILLPRQCQAAAPAPAPSIASTRCQKCPVGYSAGPLNLNITVLVETDVAQFYSYNSEGAILVYFVARATFSEAPSQLKLTDFDVEEGASPALDPNCKMSNSNA